MNVLLAEDDALLADALIEQLQEAGFQVEHAPNGPVAEYLLLKQPFDLAILDVGLPMQDGLTVLRRVRAAKPNLPVVLLTALDGLDDRVAGLNAGADDYVTKPFDFPELEARRASVDGSMLDLSPREWTLLDLLVSQRDRVVTKEQIAQAWGTEAGESGSGNSTEVYIHRLRRKLEGSKVSIRTVRGLGYLLESDPDLRSG